MSLASELEVEMTNLWSLLHSTASGCISIGMWEIIKEFRFGAAGTWAIFITASVAMVHAVHRHRRAVYRTLRDNQFEAALAAEAAVVDVDGAAVTHEPPNE